MDCTRILSISKRLVSSMIKKELGIESGSKVPNRDKVGSLSMAQVEKIAKQKFSDMGVVSIESAIKMVIGTARSMGVNVESIIG